MDDLQLLARQFESNRNHLRSVAYRLLGNQGEADDAVQEAWLRLSRTDTSGVENLKGWLTTVVARLCLDMLRARKSRREDPLSEQMPEGLSSELDGSDPEHELLMSDSVSLALLVVLETLTPAERLAFVLHDLFAVPFDEIAPVVGRSPGAARQLASRARRRVRGASTSTDVEFSMRQEIVGAFLAASRDGDFSALLALLDPDVLVRADGVAAKWLTASEIRGADAVAKTFVGRAQAAQPALIDGAPGLVWAPHGRVRAVFSFTISNGKISQVDLITEPERIGGLDLTILED